MGFPVYDYRTDVRNVLVTPENICLYRSRTLAGPATYCCCVAR